MSTRRAERGATPAAEIATALGGRHNGVGWVAPCPSHPDSDPSLSLTDSHGRVLVHCFAGCTQAAVIAALRERGLWPASRQQRRWENRKQRRDNTASVDTSVRTAGARRIWEQTQPAQGTIVDTYLRARGIELHAIPETLRFHAALRYTKNGPTLPAMVAAVQDINGTEVAIHRTFLRADGSGKADVDKPKKMLGPVRGCAVRFTEAGQRLVVGEGIESSLPALAATGLPTWAALSASGIVSLELPPLPLAGDIIVAADGDSTGLRAAREAAPRWIAEGRRVWIAVPPDGMDFNDVLREHGLEGVVALIDAAKEVVDTQADRDRGDDGRPLIRLDDPKWNACVRAAADAIRDTIYMRDTVPTLLRAIEHDDGHVINGAIEIDGVRHGVGSMALLDATPDRVRFQLDERARFEKKRKAEWIPTRCHSDIARQVVANAVDLRFRPCAGIVHVPLFVNGELITTPGWHQPSGLVLDVALLPAFPAHPTRADAERALERLLHPFRGFRGVLNWCALATAALTAVLRPSLPTAPAILLDGNAPGVGKGLIARTLSVLVTGGRPATITEGHNSEETEKRISAALLSGVPVMLLDNLQRHVASSALESALTEGVATIRAFGALTNLHVPCRALILLTANNATLRRDMLRRTLPVRIVVPSEAPEQRQFDFDPVAEARRERPELLAAAYTVALAWWRVRHLPEHAVRQRTLGSFVEWSDFVAGAVSWLTGQHPIDLIEERKAEDHHVGAERAIIEALVAHYGETEWRAADAAQAIPVELWANVMPRLKQGDKSPSPRDVGNWLRARKDRVFNTWILAGLPDRKGVAAWRLTPTAGCAGCAGSDLPHPSDLATAHPHARDHLSCEMEESTPGDTRHTRHPADGGDGADRPSTLLSDDSERF